MVDKETLAKFARLESPKFEGTPEAPTKDATDSQEDTRADCDGRPR